jgi:hypothetical protein
MAMMLEVSCRQCGAQSQQLDGATMSGPRPRCWVCGRSRLVSVEDVIKATTDGQSVDWSDANIAKLAGPCKCGGTFSEDAPLRCKKCRSTDLDRHDYGIAD